MEEEIWKDIEGFEDYQISNLGRVKSFKQGKDEYLLKVSKSNNYLSLILSKNKKGFRHSIHRLIAIHFIPNPDNKPQVIICLVKNIMRKPERKCLEKNPMFGKESKFKGRLHSEESKMKMKEAWILRKNKSS